MHNWDRLGSALLKGDSVWFWIWIWLLLLSRMQKIITNATTTTTTTKATTTRAETALIFMELVIFMQIAKSQSKLSQRFKMMTLKCCSPDPFLPSTPTLTQHKQLLYCVSVCVYVCNGRVEWFIYKHVPPFMNLSSRIMVQFSFDLSFQFNPYYTVLYMVYIFKPFSSFLYLQLTWCTICCCF